MFVLVCFWVSISTSMLLYIVCIARIFTAVRLDLGKQYRGDYSSIPKDLRKLTAQDVMVI